MRTQSGKRTNGNEHPHDISYVHRTLETEGTMIAREHSAAGSAIFLFFTVLFCCEEPVTREEVPWYSVLCQQKKCVRVTVDCKDTLGYMMCT